MVKFVKTSAITVAMILSSNISVGDSSPPICKTYRYETVNFCGNEVRKDELDSLVRYVISYESEGKRHVKNTSSTAYGYFQITDIARKQLGHKISKDSTKQVETFIAYMEHIHEYMLKYDLDKYVGSTVNGEKATLEGLITVGYVIGPYRLKKWLKSGKNRYFIPSNVSGASKHAVIKFINW